MGSLDKSSSSSRLRSEEDSQTAMDAFRKKMKSLKDETDGLYAIIQKFEDATTEANRVADQADCDIRDYGKKVHGFEIEFDETLDKLNKANEQFEEKDKLHKEVEGDIAALTRRIMLMEERLRRPRPPWPTLSPSLLS